MKKWRIWGWTWRENENRIWKKKKWKVQEINEWIVEKIEKGKFTKGFEEGIIFVLTKLANDPDTNFNIEKMARKFTCSVREVANEK